MTDQQQSTTVLRIEDYDPIEAGTLKTTQAGKTVIQLDLIQARAWRVGEICRLSASSTRLFRIDGQGQPFPSGGDVAAYAKAHNTSKAQARRDMQDVYLYVAEVTPAPVAVPSELPQRAADRTCVRCDDANGQHCPMSEDGEGPHEIMAVQAVTPEDAAFLGRYEIHMEQGAAER